MRPVLPLSLCLLTFSCLWRSPMAVGAQDLSFPRAVELAEDHSEILMLRSSAVKRAGMAADEAQSRLGPELTFRAAGGYMAHPPLTITVQPGDISEVPVPIPAAPLTFPEDKPSGTFDLSLQISQPLHTWGKLKSSVELADLETETATAELLEGWRGLRRAELLTREQWGRSRIAVQQERLTVLQQEYLFELALYELESLAGFPWTPEVSVPIK